MVGTDPQAKVAQAALVKRDPEKELEARPDDAVRRWAAGEATLKELKGYTEEELFRISQLGYTLFLNGKVSDAKVVFEGLVAVDPRKEYYYRALGVVYHRLGDAERALRQFSHAITVSPQSVAAFVNRAEVHISRRDMDKALADLEQAIRYSGHHSDPLGRKARALRSLLMRKQLPSGR